MTSLSSSPPPRASRRTFFNSVDWPALASSAGDGCDIRIASLCALGQAMAEFFDQLGVAFKPAKSDVSGNVRKMTDAAGQLDGAALVGEVLERELAEGVSKRDPSGTVGLVWFKRGLEYLFALLCFLMASRHRQEDFGISELCRRAYDATLRRRHAWLVQKTFGVVLSAAPYRSKFLEKLAFGDQSVSTSEVYTSMAESLIAMRGLLDCLNAALGKFNAEEAPLPDLQALSALAAGADIQEAGP